ncbi:MAG: IMP cyclohydrolase [Nanoarchaeota archaeon]|nr:IMP cyclohydrolase [Nanoarchaeota archaeon]
MAYKGRVGILGNYEGNPFVGFILASKSDADRYLLVDEEKNTVWTAPGKKLKQEINERPYEAVDNLYACLVGFHDKNDNPVAVSFNGRMSKRVKGMVNAGESIESSLRQILSVFVPDPRDPRIGAIASFNGAEKVFNFGVYDRTERPYLEVQQVDVNQNQAAYRTLTECKKIKTLALKKADTLDELSKQLFDEILGIPAESGCGAAVCMIDGNEFRFGAYNQHNQQI